MKIYFYGDYKMCSRYGIAAEFNLLEKTYHVTLPEFFVQPKGLIYPHHPAPVIISKTIK